MFDPGTIITLLLAGIGSLIWLSLPEKKFAFQLKSPIIMLALLMYVVKGISLLISDSPLGIATVALLVKAGVTSANTAGTLYLTAAFSALLGTFMPMPVGIFFFIPQMAMLLGGSYSALSATLCGCYADGVLRPHLFILADQIPAILVGIFYAYTIFVEYIKGLRKLHDTNPQTETIDIR